MSAQRVRANPAGILLMLQLATAVLSAVLNNVSTVLLMVPVTLVINAAGSITLTANPNPANIGQNVTLTAAVTPITATGIVTFDETLISQVAPRFSGFVERLHVDATGQQVGRG